MEVSFRRLNCLKSWNNPSFGLLHLSRSFASDLKNTRKLNRRSILYIPPVKQRPELISQDIENYYISGIIGPKTIRANLGPKTLWIEKLFSSIQRLAVTHVWQLITQGNTTSKSCYSLIKETWNSSWAALRVISIEITLKTLLKLHLVFDKL